MKIYIFAASDEPLQDVSESIAALCGLCTPYAQVVLNSDGELKRLLQLIGVKSAREIELTSSKDFAVAFDFSDQSLPDLDKEAFDTLFDEWILMSAREVTMDEYGQLVFLQSSAAAWNKRRNRFVLREKA